MSGDDPPYLPVGTDVSAKYKGAFCEAKVSKVVRVLSLKVTYIGAGLGTGTVTDEQIRIPGAANQPPGAGLLPLRVGQTIQVKHPEKREFVNATINRIRDCSQYTVVFDDGDITTLRRTALCLKSGRHFNESETLDQLPLTHPEHFGNPVVGGRRGRRSRQLKEDSSDDDDLDDMELDRNSVTTNSANMGRDVGKVVCVETSEGKRKSGRDSNWFPGLVVAPTAQAAVRINTREECLIRSFKDGRYYTVPRKEITEFKRDGATSRVDSPPLAEAVDKALNYLDTAELPQHWDRDTLFGLLVDYDSDENYSDSSDDEPREEKDHFVAQLYKFMDDRGTPLNKGPIICNRDVDLYRFFRNVEKLGGFNSVTNKNRWRAVTSRLGFTKNSATTLNLVKQAYSRFLLPFEEFNRKLGCTMVSHPRGARKNRGRNLIRDKDRSTPVQASPKPEIKTEDSDTMSEKEKKDDDTKKRTRKEEMKIKKEPEDSSSSDENVELVKKHIETPSTSKVVKKEKIAKRVKPITGEKVRALVEKFEEKEDDDKVQQTRSKASTRKDSSASSPDRKVRPESKTSAGPSKPRVNRPNDDEKKKKIVKKKEDEKLSDSSSSDPVVVPNVNIGDKLKVYYGPNFDSKVTYEAKVLETEKDESGTIYLVHYTGWNNRYDEWIKPHRIAENITQSSKGKRPTKSTKNLNSSAPASTSSSAAKRGRGPSVSSRNTSQEAGPPSQARSTTPSSITSSSSRTKSPATPAVRAPSARLAKQAETVVKRSTSVTPQTQQSSTASDSDSGSSDAEETPKRKPLKRKEETPERNLDEDGPTERPKRIRKTPKKHSDSIMTLSSNSNSSTSSIKIEPIEQKASTVSTFDLNKIRSELKGFEKALKITPIVPVEETSPPISSPEPKILLSKITTEEIKKREKTPEKEEVEIKKEATDDIYEFKEPEPLELETRGTKLTEEKIMKKRRLLEDLDKPSEKISPVKKKIPARTLPKVDDKKSKYRRTFSRKSDDSESSSSSPRSKSPNKLDNQTVEVTKTRYASEDAFDKLVVSPSFNLKSSPKSAPEEDEDEKSSDEESTKIEEVSPIKIEEVVAEDDEDDDSSSSSESSDEDAPIHEAIRGIEESKNDEESADDLLDDPALFEPKEIVQLKLVPEKTPPQPPNEPIFTPIIPEKQPEKVIEKPPTPIPEPLKAKSPEPLAIKIEKTTIATVKKEEKVKISPALQETDSSLLSLLEAAINQPSPDIPITENLYIPKRSGPRIAGSILQKFDAIKKKEENPSPVKSEPVPEIESEVTLEVVKEEVVLEEKVEEVATSPVSPEFKRRPLPKKNLSREFIEFEDSDSSDSEERLVIARSDDDSQLSQPDSLSKIEDSNGSGLRINEDSSQDEKPKSPEPKKDLEEPDSNISLLLCEETIPGSPAPVSEGANTTSAQEQGTRVKPKSAKSLVMEIPFASAPGTSKTEDVKPISTPSSMVQSVTTNVVTSAIPETKQVDEVNQAGNSGPSTPNSSISNLSPRGENGGSSPGTADEGNKSRRGSETGDIEQPFSGLRVLKPHRYSEEDSILLAENSSLDRTKQSIKNSPRSINEDSQPPLPQLSSPNPTTNIVLTTSITGIPSNRKRRKSFKGDDAPSHPPSGAKRGRKPNVLKNLRANLPSSTNSDSDDASEHSSAASGITIPIGPSSGSNNTGELRLHSIHHSISGSSMQRTSKYNFMVEFDSCMDASQRIALLQQRISDIRKAYSHEKNDLASIERRLKKIRRREREAMKAAKQEVACS